MLQEIVYPQVKLQCELACAEATTLTSGNVAFTTELLESGKAQLTVTESEQSSVSAILTTAPWAACNPTHHRSRRCWPTAQTKPHCLFMQHVGPAIKSGKPVKNKKRLFMFEGCNCGSCVMFFLHTDPFTLRSGSRLSLAPWSQPFCRAKCNILECGCVRGGGWGAHTARESRIF